MKPVHLRALVVDDDPSWQNILQEILTDLGLAVDVAGTLDEAIPLLRAEVHRLALIDLSLKATDHRNQDGIKVLDTIKRYDPGCVSILLTGHATVEIAVSVLTEHGAYTCLRKENFTRSGFRELIQQALSSASPFVDPASRVASQPSDRAKAADTAAPARVGTALVVEDDAGWRSVIAELLRELGYQVRLCSSFGEAIGSLGREQYDLAVVDLSLTGSLPRTLHATGGTASPSGGDQQYEGFRLLISTRAANIPTIVVTGVANPQDIEHIYAEYGILYCLQKQSFDRGAFRRAASEIRSSRRVSRELQHLTERELQVLSLIAQGMTNKEIADTLFISTNTVKRHLKAIFAKLGTHTRAATATRAISAGLQGGWQPIISSDAS